MTNFLLLPISEVSQGFRVGLLLCLASQAWSPKARYVRVLDSSLSKNDVELAKELGVENACAMASDVLLRQLCSGDSSELEETLAAYFLGQEQDEKGSLWVEGFISDKSQPYLFNLNRYLSSILKAQLILCLDVQSMSAQAAAFSLLTTLRLCFDSDINALGFILINMSADSEEYVLAVEKILKTNSYPLPCILALKKELADTVDATQLKQLLPLVHSKPLQQVLEKLADWRMAPAVYRVKVIEKAKQVKKTIVLPEGSELRTVKATIICHQKNIAQCVLLTKQAELTKTLSELKLTLPDDVRVIDPDDIRDNYLNRLLELRRSRGLTKEKAKKLLEDNVFVGTMMLENGEVDGLVSGAVHTTANTIRPALQVIKLAPPATIVSSIFFMLMPNEVLVFGDCAVNIDLTAEQLAEVAIQSADSAQAFGIKPKVALISYSTKDSGSGTSVDKVKKALAIVQAQRPDIIIDGPLQYDAASVPSVAQKKAPGSVVAGQANVFIFPGLDTGNAVYKAVQRTGHIVSVGPMLQGLNKAVNDLSRGALVDDIVFTIAITAIQASQKIS